MMIVHGQKLARAFQGWMAAFCPICRTVRPHRVERVSLVPHVYWVATGSGTQLHDELTCDQCKAVLAAAFGSARRTALRKEPPPVDRVDQEMYPWSIAELDKRLELEQRVHTGRITPEERALLLREPFERVEYAHELAVKRGVWVSVRSVLLLVAIGGGIAAYILWTDRARQIQPPASLTAWACGCTAASALAIAACAWLYLSLPRLAGRAARRRILASLRPLRPSPDEMAQVLRGMPRDRTSPARAVRPSDFAAAHAAAQVVEPPGR